jgi:hypothetical protein
MPETFPSLWLRECGVGSEAHKMLGQTHCAEVLAKRPTGLRNSTDVQVLRKEGRPKSVAAWSVVRVLEPPFCRPDPTTNFCSNRHPQACQLSISISLNFQEASPLLHLRRKFAHQSWLALAHHSTRFQSFNVPWPHADSADALPSDHSAGSAIIFILSAARV